MARLARNGGAFRNDLSPSAADGVFRPFLTRIAPDIGPDGRIRPCLGTNTEVTEERQIRAALEASEARLRLFIERAPAGIAMFDKEMRYLSVSQRFMEDYNLVGETPQSLQGRGHYELFPELPERWREIYRRVLSGETLSAEEDQSRRPDGRTDWVRWDYLSWRLADGNVGGALLFSEVITRRKEVEVALRESQQRLEALIQAAMDAIIAIDASQRIVLLNPAAERMFKCPASEALGAPIDRFIPEQYRQAHRTHVRRFGATGVTSRHMGGLGSVRGLRDDEEFPIRLQSRSSKLVGKNCSL